MKRLILMFVGLCIFFLVLFLVGKSFNIPIFDDPEHFLENLKHDGEHNDLLVSAVSGGLLISDILLPIPSNIVMTFNGKYFGIISGTALNLAGMLLSSLIAFYIGLKSKHFVKKVLSEKEFEKGRVILDKWGMMAIILSRPIPILAESICIVAGASSMKLHRMLLASFIGNIPPCFIYAYFGSKMDSAADGILIFGAVILLSVICLIVAHFWSKSET